MMTKEEKLQLAKEGKELDVLVKDEDFEVRKAVAEFGRPEDLDVLVKDKKITVRRAVMKHQRKQDLEILKNDVYYRLREEAEKSLNK